MPLTAKQRRSLKAQAHHLNPVVQVGGSGLSDAVLRQVDQALEDHELIKVQVGAGAPLDRHEAGEALSRQARAELVQVIGRIVILYRRHPEEPRIELPEAPS